MKLLCKDSVIRRERSAFVGGEQASMICTRVVVVALLTNGDIMVHIFFWFSRCVFFRKPLLESGTLGTKCNVQV